MSRITGGGWRAIWYAFLTARRAGGPWKFYRALRSRNACKTCALGMGGQLGGMVNEAGHFPEVCKKSMQAMAADMQGRIEPQFWTTYSIDQLRRCTPRELEHMGRLAEPVLAGPGDSHFRVISWDEALEFCARQLRGSSPEQNFFYASGRSSNEAGFLLQLFARLYGTNNVNNCSYYCHQASAVGLHSVLGSTAGTIRLEDLDRCDLVFLIGANPASNHPRLMRTLLEVRRRGGQVIVINPLKEAGLIDFRVPSDVRSLLFGADITSLYLQPHIGGDIALLTAIAKCLLEEGLPDDGAYQHLGAPENVSPLSALEQCFEGFADFRRMLDSLSLDELARQSGSPLQDIRRAAALYRKSRATVFAWTMGITHHLHGVDNVRAIANLALLRGMLGKAGAGLLPIRGHSNVQGIGSIGVTPALRPDVKRRLEIHLGVRLPETPGMDTLSCMEAMSRGEIRHAWCLGGNLFGANPDAAFMTRAFSKLDSVVYLSTTLNTGHVLGRGQHTLILPVLPRDEESQPTTQESMFSYVRLSDGGPRRLHGPRSEVEVIAALARSVLGDGGPVDWNEMRNHSAIRKLISAVTPGYEDIGWIDRTRKEFFVAGRALHNPPFPTPSGKARFHAMPVPPAPAPGELRLMTIRSEGQFNTVVYEDYDVYRGQDRRDVILMHADDLARRDLRDNQWVVVRSEVGALRVLARQADIRAGNAAMYYPEANALVPRTADKQSRTPAYKNVAVTVEAVATGGAPVLVPLNVDASLREAATQTREIGPPARSHERSRAC